METRQTGEPMATSLIEILCERAEIHEGLDWHRLLESAEIHRLMLPLRLRARGAPRSAIPAWVVRELDESFWAWAPKRLAYLELLDRIGTIASRRGVRLLLLKGPDLAERLYRIPESRQFRDLDIMVSENHLESLTRALVDHGFVPISGPYAGLPMDVIRRWELPLTLAHRDAPGLHVDLHLNVTHRLEPYRLDPERFWAGGRPSRLGFLRLSDDDFLFFLFVHSLKHGYLSLLSFWDLHLASRDTRLASRFPAVLQSARSEGYGVLIQVAAELGRRLFGTEWPDAKPLAGRIRWAANWFETRARQGHPWISERAQLMLSAGLLVESMPRLLRYWRLSVLRPPSTIPAQPYQASPWSNPWASTVRLARSIGGSRGTKG